MGFANLILWRNIMIKEIKFKICGLFWSDSYEIVSYLTVSWTYIHTYELLRHYGYSTNQFKEFWLSIICKPNCCVSNPGYAIIQNVDRTLQGFLLTCLGKIYLFLLKYYMLPAISEMETIKIKTLPLPLWWILMWLCSCTAIKDWSITEHNTWHSIST